MTRDEAEKKWCPFARSEYGYAPNRRADGLPIKGTLCLTDKCMMWIRYGDEELNIVGMCAFNRKNIT